MAIFIQSSLDGYFVVSLASIRSIDIFLDTFFRLSLLSGIPYNIIVIDIPQRFQAVYGTSPFGAGVRLIPFNFLIALSSVLVNIVASKTRIPPIFLLLAGSIIQLIGLALFSTLSDGLMVPSVIYGWEVISGTGIGIVMGMLLVLPPHLVEPRDLGMFSRISTKPIPYRTSS